MRRRTVMFAAACAAAVAIPVSGASAGNGQAKAAAAKQCAAEKKADKAAFKATYGKRAMRTCKKGTTGELAGEAKNAAKECKAERSADPATFATTYGTNRNGKNAFGKCVSSKVADEVEENVEEFENAAKTCRAERRADSDAFMEQWGTNAPRGENSRGAKRNAFGKCVSATAQAQDDDAEEAPAA